MEKNDEKISTFAEVNIEPQYKMPKYRLLSLEELTELEKEFVEYLVLNGIAKDDWEKLKKTDNEKAQNITELFSDVVFEKIMREVNYLIKFEKSTIYGFKCEKDNIQLISIETDEKGIDFTTKEGQKVISSGKLELKGFQASKEYKDQREQEIYKMIENGCSIADEKWYNALEQMV